MLVSYVRPNESWAKWEHGHLIAAHDMDDWRLLFITQALDHTTLQAAAKDLHVYSGKFDQAEHVYVGTSAACAKGIANQEIALRGDPRDHQ
ncbi:hypothetical protein [Thauera chlorobenzoica]|uniref:hypothetical protein n=1 Tax=Thauera chlorobenzoica TaxID=96773 RepID=UPI0008A030CB|nr:hypothetical protein [Thauera chlorobenzoica]SEF67419.1 hypothetical protein SAMN05216242_103243 [Thauera chlorobenzoica]